MIDDSILELLRILAWPTIIILGCFFFRKSLKRLAEVIPEKIAGTKKLSVGSFSLELQQRAVSMGSPELHQSLYQISEDELKLLLASKTSATQYGIFARTDPEHDGLELSTSNDLEATRGLIDRGLLECTIPFSEVENFIIDHRLVTPEGWLNSGDIRREFSKKEIESIPDWDRIIGAAVGMTDLGRVAYKAVFSTTVHQLRADAFATELDSSQ